MRIKPAASDPIMAPIVFIAYIELTVFPAFLYILKYRSFSSGKRIPIINDGII